jgi:AAA ATPase domain
MLWPLVGRGAELAEIRAAMTGGQLGGVVLSGDAGVGKTRLAGEALQRAAGEGFATEWVVATRAAAPIPLAPFAFMLPPLAEAVDRYQMLVGAAKALADRAAGRRLVLAVDDAHLLDDVSAALVSQLVRRRACFVVATLRVGEPMPEAVSGLRKDGVADRIALWSLSPEEVGALLSAAVGSPMEPETVHRLWVATEGNALFLRELVADGMQLGQLAAQGSVWRWEGPVAGSGTAGGGGGVAARPSRPSRGSCPGGVGSVPGGRRWLVSWSVPPTWPEVIWWRPAGRSRRRRRVWPGTTKWDSSAGPARC